MPKKSSKKDREFLQRKILDGRDLEALPSEEKKAYRSLRINASPTKLDISSYDKDKLHQVIREVNCNKYSAIFRRSLASSG